VLGDAMAMPIGSMIAKFRPEFEQHIERAREAADRLSLELGVGAPAADEAA
jgi:NADH-quinone oxidoreductase subunit F